MYAFFFLLRIKISTTVFLHIIVVYGFVVNEGSYSCPEILPLLDLSSTPLCEH